MSAEMLIVDCWEKCNDQHSLEAPLTLLNSVIPSKSKKDFAGMDIGKRNSFLFHVREKLFGKGMNFLTYCPNCNTKLESVFSFKDIAFPEEKNQKEFFEFSSANYKIRYRLPNSYDLASASKCKDIVSARNEILNRCILELFEDEKAIPISVLPEEIISQLSCEMSDKNPYAEIRLNLVCQDCNHTWTSILDIASFILSEINFYAQNILRDVHALASAYHWSESDIFKMSPDRRNWYINLIES